MSESKLPESASAVMRTTPARVAKVDRNTHDTFTLTVEPVDGNSCRLFGPGQFSMLYAFGVGELPISISGDPHEPGRLVYTIRSVGPATQKLVSCRPGDVIGVRGPSGTSGRFRRPAGKTS